jgi:hypothetical protein
MRIKLKIKQDHEFNNEIENKLDFDKKTLRIKTRN